MYIRVYRHGNLSPADQKRVFEIARRNELKIVVSTNVAEASVTLPDVKNIYIAYEFAYEHLFICIYICTHVCMSQIGDCCDRFLSC
jgi:hypothetical protein